MRDAYTDPRTPVPGKGRLSVTWIGHATALIELDGARLLTDPVLRDRIGHLKRLVPSPAPAALGRLDCVLLSHLHADHADLPTLRALDLHGPILAPPPASKWLADRGFAETVALSVGAAADVAGVRVSATVAVHDGRRMPYGPAAEAVGFLVCGSASATAAGETPARPSVYFAGDTDLHPSMRELRERVHVALMPVWGWGPRLGPGHLDPQRAAEAVAMIRPRLAVPIHWGTFTVRTPGRRTADPARPAHEFADHVHRLAPEVEVRVLAPGASVSTAQR